MKRILVGLDGSPRAADVLKTAVTTAWAHGGKLTLLHASSAAHEVPREFWKETDEPLESVLRRQCEQYLRQEATNVPRELLERTEFRIGVPWEAICATAREEHADLIIIGSHGYSGVDHVLGTTAAKVVNHAPCSVLVVRGHTAV